MKTNWHVVTISSVFIISILSFSWHTYALTKKEIKAASIGASASANTDSDALQSQISSPATPEKAASHIKEYMLSVKSTLNHNKLEANLVRGGEVVQTVIPCEKLFASNSTDLRHAAAGYLRFFNSLLKYPKMYKIVVAVNSDNTGEDSYRKNLTEKRAQAIRDYFTKASDSNGSNLFCYGVSDSRPLAPDNKSLANRERNRRVEIYIVPGEQMVQLASAGKLRY